MFLFLFCFVLFFFLFFLFFFFFNLSAKEKKSGRKKKRSNFIKKKNPLRDFSLITKIHIKTKRSRKKTYFDVFRQK